jgi:predicted ATP-grasp superfamily ATP-dependent carboligase
MKVSQPLVKQVYQAEQGNSFKEKRAPYELSEKEKRIVEKLKAIDRKVRAHEMAHLSVAGPYAQGVSFSYVKGPDGMLYAVSGEVKLDVSEVPNDPEATIRKAEIIERAALAPVDPSPQDLAVAAKARAMKMKAMMEKLKNQREGTEKKGEILNIKV